MKARSMQDHISSDTAGWLAASVPTLCKWASAVAPVLAKLAPLVAKLVPAGFGALIMVAIDPPQDRRELFWRLAAAGMCSIFLGDIALDGLHSWWAFIDPAKHTHQASVSFLVGACGWFLLGGLGVALKKLRADPVAAIAEAKKDLIS